MDPWWHLDFQVTSPLAPEALWTRLQQPMKRLRGRPDGPDAVILVRHGALMNQFVRARATFATSGSGTAVSVRIARPSYVSIFMTAVAVLMIVVPLLQTVLVGVTKGFAGGLPASAVALVLDPVIWAVVVGANFTSARSEARDLVGLIGKVLANRD